MVSHNRAWIHTKTIKHDYNATIYGNDWFRNTLMFYHPKPGYCHSIKSREQRLVTKEHIAMHTNLILWFNLLNLVIKL